MASMRSVVLFLCILASFVNADPVRYCVTDEEKVCFTVGIPDSTASSGGGGDIYIQIQGPSTMQWIGLGQGNMMRGANMFIIYADPTETNVTLSGRRATGHSEPQVARDASVFLLDGSGIKDGVMTANIRCGTCQSWQGGSMDLTSASSEWIYGYRTGDAIKSESTSAQIGMHSGRLGFSLDLSKALSGASLNPFLDGGGGGGTDSAPPPPANKEEAPSGSKGDDQTADNKDDQQDTIPEETGGHDQGKVVWVHGTVMVFAFVIGFPLGAVLLRVASMQGVVWIHAGIQLASYIGAVLGLMLGVYISNHVGHKLTSPHQSIGSFVVIVLFAQPILGYLHHLRYKRTHLPSGLSAVHVWLGRVLVTLGLVNGILGLRLAGQSAAKQLLYLLVAGLVWLAWVLVVWIREKRKGKLENGKFAQGRGGGRGEGGIRMATLAEEDEDEEEEFRD